MYVWGILRENDLRIVRLSLLYLIPCSRSSLPRVYRSGLYERIAMDYAGVVLKDRYELLSSLGEGGHGRVYLARDRHLEQFAAVKAVGKEHPSAVEALERECSILCGLHHPAIPRILDFFREQELVYLVMEFVEGRNLQELSGQEVPGTARLYEWGMQICEILSYLHRECRPPLIYGDLKPANLILGRDGRIRLVDFGSTVPFRDGRTAEQHLGTIGFAAPEQYPSEDIPLTCGADIYGLGATLKVLAEGRLRSFWLTWILHKCMRTKPEKRYASVIQLYRNFQIGRFFCAKKK